MTEVHQWVGACVVPLDAAQANTASLRGYIKLQVRARINVLEVYCDQCHRPYDAVFGDPCAAAASNEHLRGGPIGTRKKRKGRHPYHDCDPACPEFIEPEPDPDDWGEPQDLSPLSVRACPV
jgi:hypothetical protein